MNDFTPVGVRARGLLAHLLSRAELEALAGADGPSLARGLARSGRLLGPVGDTAQAAELERAMRETTKRHLATLARWDGAAPVLEVFAADQDRRSVRALLRGALQAAPTERRLSGLVPTASLPERVLAELARQPTPADVVAHLFALGHPDADRLLPLTAKKAQPDLFALDLALVQGFAERCVGVAKLGDDPLRQFVAHRLDLCNAQAAVLLGNSPDVDAACCFVDGGVCLSRQDFLGVAKAATPRDGAMLLRRALASTALAGVVGEGQPDASTLERQGVVLILEGLRRATREQPLSSAPVLLFLARLDAMARDVRRLSWAAALGAPAALVRPDLVTPWR